jgi:hypothetical protein
MKRAHVSLLFLAMMSVLVASKAQSQTPAQITSSVADPLVEARSSGAAPGFGLWLRTGGSVTDAQHSGSLKHSVPSKGQVQPAGMCQQFLIYCDGVYTDDCNSVCNATNCQ